MNTATPTALPVRTVLRISAALLGALSLTFLVLTGSALLVRMWA
jgi:hypothetical protein